MRAFRSLACAALALVALVASPADVHADVYMANPRGSNNRLNEKSATRANNNRMFDSQNNARGGFNVGDRGVQAFDGSQGNDYGVMPPSQLYNTATNNPADKDIKKQYQMVYYEGSELSVEWTNQHGCGGNEASDPHKLNCEIILQYMCQTTDGTQQASGALQPTPANTIPGAESLRDGSNTQQPDEMGNAADYGKITGNLARGHHESEMYFYECNKRSRNRGLFTADQNLQGKTARYTRQNNGGTRRGLECPEERDYYPYWSPSPWKDIVVMTDHTELFCDADGKYKGASQNNNDVYKCVVDPTAAGADAAIAAITKSDCDTAGGAWTAFTHGLPAPQCIQAPWSRVNHLGNGRDGQPLTFNWTLPWIADGAGKPGDIDSSKVYLYDNLMAKCVLRLRYNMSTDDFDPYNTTSKHNNNRNAGVESPVTNNPTVDIGAGYEGVKLAVNTAQFGRTFEDRSHVFYIRRRPASIPRERKIYNLNVRGKRGNIVQTFPAIEYDFQPARLVIKDNDLVHVQWTGSNTHNNQPDGGDGQTGDAGEGTGGTDRHNIAQLKEYAQNYPMPLDKFPDNMWSRSVCSKLDGTPLSSLPTGTPGALASGTAPLDCSVYMTTSGQYKSVAEVVTPPTGTPATFNPLLNDAPASLVGGVVMQFPAYTGAPDERSYDYMCTRNNNFSNRGQKGTIVVQKSA